MGCTLDFSCDRPCTIESINKNSFVYIPVAYFFIFDSSIFANRFSLQTCVVLPTPQGSVLDQIWTNSDPVDAYFAAQVGPLIGSSDHNIELDCKGNKLSTSSLLKFWTFASQTYSRKVLLSPLIE